MKYAYLIMAHYNFKMLKVLLMIIDDERNVIYMYGDKNVVKLI